MRAVLTAAVFVLAAGVPAIAQPLLPPAPVTAPTAPQQTPAPVQPPVITPYAAPGTSGLYNVLNYGQNGARCTPSPLVPTACR